jgi:UDP-4-amino-4-deoxy-L-arabinose formyltransferase/UDP-glucuronic acid dehydrogenase (UDP-4-keto-hexauronic acid decarboxylating)
MKAVVLAYHNMGITGLNALLQNGFEIAAIFTHEDDPHENCWFGSVKEWAQKQSIPYETTESINSPAWVERIASLKPDILFSFYYRKMISRAILDIPRLGALNLHGSLLPAYRGRCPVNWVLVKGENRTGVTLHYMVDKPDAGDIVGQKEVKIEFDDTARTLYDKLCVAAGILLAGVLPVIKMEQIPRRKQDLTKGSYYGGRRPEDGRIDWKQSAEDIYNLIRAVTDPYPGAYAFLENGDPIILWWATPAKTMTGCAPGTVFMSGQDVLVQTGNDAIRFLDIEIKGKRVRESQIFELFKSGKVTKLL